MDICFAAASWAGMPGATRTRNATCGRATKHGTGELRRRARMDANSTRGEDRRSKKAGARLGDGKTGSTHGMTISRDWLEKSTRENRTCRSRRHASLKELDASDGEDGGNRVEVLLVGRRLGRKNFLVEGVTRCKLGRRCDRCDGWFEEESRGGFAVVLDGGGMEGVEEAEAVEGFGEGVLEVDLRGHVRDGVLLGVGTKSLCGVGCLGVSGVVEERFGSVRYAGEGGMVEEKKEKGGRQAFAEEGVAEALLRLRDKLEREGR